MDRASVGGYPAVMAERPAAGWEIDDELELEESRLITETDAPVDSIFQEKQQRLLTSALLDTWPGPVGPEGERLPYLAVANVGLFFALHEPPIVPDMMLSIGVSLPEDLAPKENRSYFMWRYGKPPDVVVEIVSNREGGELDRKRRICERIRIAHYVVYDPLAQLGDVRLRSFELLGDGYVDRLDARFDRLGLSLVEWEGRFEDLHARWLRWASIDGVPIPVGRERAESERARAERLAARLRELGIDPDEE